MWGPSCKTLTELFGALAKAVTVAKVLQNMVGPWGLEPQASTLSSDRSSKSLQQDTRLFNNLTRHEPTMGDTICLENAPLSGTSIDTRVLGASHGPGSLRRGVVSER